MNLTQLAKQKISWIENNLDIVISSRIRLARNIQDKPFPGKAKKTIQKEVFDSVVESIQYIPEFENAAILNLNNYDKIDRLLLMERHLISHEHASKTTGEPGVIFTTDEKISIMINEEDHLRIQILSPQLSAAQSWNTISKIDDSLNEKLQFAYHKKFGFLTACPTNVGTGLRVSCLLHLPVLVMTNQMDKLINSLQKVNINVRGFYGEGTRPLGDIFQFSNSTTLGKTEEEIILNFERIINTVIKYEQEARKKIIADKETKYKLQDKIARAYGIISYTTSIDSEEAIQHLSKLRLIDFLNIEFKINKTELDQLIFVIQPGHLQEISNKELTPQERDIARAKLIRNKLLN